MNKQESVIKALRNGTVPLEGTELIAVGIEDELKEIKSQLTNVSQGKSDFKMIIGDYGSGKTFFGASVRQVAFQMNFIVSNIIISQEAPLNKFEEVYKKIIEGMRKSDNLKVPALPLLLEEWLLGIEETICSINEIDPIDDEEIFIKKLKERLELDLSEVGELSSNFANAIRCYYEAKSSGNNILAQGVLGWLKGEKVSLTIKKEMNVAINLDRENSFSFIKAVNIMIKKSGYKGLVIIMDEVETVQKYLKGSSREAAYENLRYFIDETDRISYPNCYFLFTGTPELIESDRGIKSLEPLYQRLKVEKDSKFVNLRQPIIYLNNFDNNRLYDVSFKVMNLHEQIYNWNIREKITEEFISKLILDKTTAFGGEIEITPRSYLRIFVDILDKSQIYKDYYPEDNFEFNESIYNEVLNTEKEGGVIIEF